MKQRNTSMAKAKMNSAQNKLPNSRLRQGHSALPDPVNTEGKPNAFATKVARVILYAIFFLAVGITAAFCIYMFTLYLNGG